MDQAELESVEAQITRLLTVWAAGSVAKGAALAALGRTTGHDELRRFGRQNAMWGVVDGLIAGAGALTRSRRGELSADEVRTQADRLRRLLQVNAVADVGYLVGGLVIVARGRRGVTTLRMSTGDGLAILIQGAFLLALDVTFARRLAPAEEIR